MSNILFHSAPHFTKIQVHQMKYRCGKDTEQSLKNDGGGFGMEVTL
jgi:hypothetical protein